MTKITERDAEGVEYGVDEGFGRIVNVEWPIEGKRNAHVELDVEGLEYPVKGWANTLDDDIRALLADPPPRIRYRLEVHRGDKVDKTTPIADLAPKQKYRRLVQLVATDSERRTANRPPDPPPAPPTGGHLTDTWGYCAALGSIELAYDLVVAAKTAERIDKVTPALVRDFGSVLLGCANQAQAFVRGKVDLNANSHTRARGAVRTAVEHAPPPPLEIALDDEVWPAWSERVAHGASVLMGLALELMEEPAAAGVGLQPSQPSADVDSSTDKVAGGDDSPVAGSPLDRLNALRLSGKEMVEFRDLVVRNGLPWPLRDLSAEQSATFGELLASWAQDAA